MTPSTRRQFLQAAVAGSGLGIVHGSLSAIEPLRRTGKARFRLSLAAYSFRKYLDLKSKPRPAMTLDDFVEFAAGLDLDAVEPTAYYFADTSPEYLARLKGRCTRLGLDISGTAVGNDFCVADAARRLPADHLLRDAVHQGEAPAGRRHCRHRTGTENLVDAWPSGLSQVTVTCRAPLSGNAIVPR